MADMMLKVKDLIGKNIAALGQQYVPALNELVEKAGITEPRDNYLAQVAADYAPKTISPDLLVRRTPYANPAAFTADFEGASDRGWLEKVVPGEYRAADKALTYYAGVVEALDAVMAQLEETITTDLAALKPLVKRLENAAWKNDGVGEKTGLEMNAEMEINAGAPILTWVWYHLANLVSFRDDCHIAAWKAQEKDGRVWETLSYLWEENAKTAAELTEKLPYRRYQEADYDAALISLVERGWAEQADGAYRITEEGRELRLQVEAKTDELYKEIFASFSADEIGELIDLLEQLAGEITPASEEQAA